MAKDIFDYTKKAAELEEILTKLQDPDIQIDEATKLYDAGVAIANAIEDYLQQAENTVHAHTVAREP